MPRWAVAEFGNEAGCVGDGDDIAQSAFGVFFAHAGQGCSLQTRMLVPQEHKAAVLEAVAATAGSSRRCSSASVGSGRCGPGPG